MTVIKVKQPAIRNIEQRAMMRRLTQAERIGIRMFLDDTTGDPSVRYAVDDAMKDLQSSPNVQLDLPEVREALEGLNTVGLLVPIERVDECLVDGTEAERYIR